jgi:hypothetical protein
MQRCALDAETVIDTTIDYYYIAKIDERLLKMRGGELGNLGRFR